MGKTNKILYNMKTRCKCGNNKAWLLKSGKWRCTKCKKDVLFKERMYNNKRGNEKPTQTIRVPMLQEEEKNE